MPDLPTEAQISRRGCKPCRAQHAKCDRRLPVCSECQKAGLECTREPDIRFQLLTTASRTSSKPQKPKEDGRGFKFSRTQKWAPTGGNLRFLDETPDLVEAYNHGRDHATTVPPPVSTEATSSTSFMRNADKVSPLSASPESFDLSNPVQHDYGISHGQRHLARDTIPSELRQHETLTGAEQPLRDATPSNRTFTFSSAESAGRRDVLSRDYRSRFRHQRPTSGGTSTHSYPGSGGANTSPFLPESAGLSPHTPFQSNESVIAVDTPSVYGNTPYLDQRSPALPGLQTSPWRLEDAEQARLLCYYVENLSRSFDLVDPARHFRVEVPRRALTCPTLLNAILALSARHLSRVTGYDPIVADQYHQKCLKHLIPTLNDPAALRDENLLVSTIILRHLEEIDALPAGQVPVDGGAKNHLLGTHVLVSANEDAANVGGLRQAAFWVGLRQEIYIAFINQHSILPPLNHPSIDRSLDPAPEHVWSNRMVVLCTDVMRYCFGDENTSTRAYHALSDSVARWFDMKPSTFEPYCWREPDDANVLPQLWFLTDEITLGWQHYYMAKIMLGVHNPTIPRLGPRRAAISRKIDEAVRETVLLLCGICQSNPVVSPNFTYAAMGIIVASDRIIDRRQQDALLRILEECDRQHALAVGHVITDLQAAWGWT